MNKSYKTVFNKTLGVWQAVAEIAKSQGKSKNTITPPHAIADRNDNGLSSLAALLKHLSLDGRGTAAGFVPRMALAALFGALTIASPAWAAGGAGGTEAQVLGGGAAGGADTFADATAGVAGVAGNAATSPVLVGARGGGGGGTGVGGGGAGGNGGGGAAGGAGGASASTTSGSSTNGAAGGDGTSDASAGGGGGGGGGSTYLTTTTAFTVIADTSGKNGGKGGNAYKGITNGKASGGGGGAGGYGMILVNGVGTTFTVNNGVTLGGGSGGAGGDAVIADGGSLDLRGVGGNGGTGGGGLYAATGGGSIVNNGVIQGGDGGNGGNVVFGTNHSIIDSAGMISGSGGNGGAGIQASGNATSALNIANNGLIQGGDGGDSGTREGSGASDGMAGTGGFGIVGNYLTITNAATGTIVGGAGGLGGLGGLEGLEGVGGVAISGSGLKITNYGVIEGGAPGSKDAGLALDFQRSDPASGGAPSTLTLMKDSSISGNIGVHGSVLIDLTDSGVSNTELGSGDIVLHQQTTSIMGTVTFDIGNNDINLGNKITGTGNIIINTSGAGVLTLSGNSTFNNFPTEVTGFDVWGGVTIQKGDVKLGSDNALGGTASRLIVNGGTLDLNNHNVTINSLSGAGGVIFTSNAGGNTLNLGPVTAPTVNTTYGGKFGTDPAGGLVSLAINTDGGPNYDGLLTLTGSGSQLDKISITEAGGLTLGMNGKLIADTVTLDAGSDPYNYDTAQGISSVILTINAKAQLDTQIFDMSGKGQLNVGIVANQPSIIAETATLGGMLGIKTLPTSITPATASVLPSIHDTYTLITSNNVITGDFDIITYTGTGSGGLPDYLVHAFSGALDGSEKNYELTVGYGLKWFAGAEFGSGTFTISDTSAVDNFEVDVVLNDQTEGGNVDFSGNANKWNGNSLTKAGSWPGTLTLSRVNTYTGATTINGGVLALKGSGSIASSSLLKIVGGTDFDISAADGDASIKRLTGDGGVVLGNNTLIITGATAGDTFNGVIYNGSGGLKISGGDQTLGGALKHTYTGDTTIDSGASLTLANTTSLASGKIVDNGALIFSQTGSASSFGGQITGSGALTQNGVATNVLTLSGANSSVGSVTVTGGTLKLAQTGTFTAGAFANNATTAIDGNARLVVHNDSNDAVFTNASGKSLNVTVNTTANGNAEGGAAIITADKASLDGALTLTGLTLPGNMNKASDLEGAGTTTLIHATNGISGDFTTVSADTVSLPDYLSPNGFKSADGNDYKVSYGLKWFAGERIGSGTFTVKTTDSVPNFEVDVVLADQPGDFSTNVNTPKWDGKSLTKAGNGVLTLSKINTYTGATTISGGTLALSGSGSIADSSGVAVASGATFDISGATGGASIKNLSGGGSVALGGKTLTLAPASGGSFSGVISGTGGGLTLDSDTFTLTGANAYTGLTTVNNGAILTFGGSTSALTGNIVNNGALVYKQSVDSSISGVFSGTGAFDQQGTKILTLSGNGSSIGNVSVSSGTLEFAQTGNFTATSFTNNATTTLDDKAQLVVHNTTNNAAFTSNGSSSVLNITLGSNVANGKALITADTATIGGQLNIAGIGDEILDSLPTSTNDLPLKLATVLQTTGSTANGVSGDFAAVTIGNSANPADYLAISGGKSADGNAWQLSYSLAWTANDDNAHGAFTLGEGESFNVGVELKDQTPTSGNVAGWNGADLTKNGDGTLILSKDNSYTGVTTINGGTLQIGNGGTTGSLGTGNVVNKGTLAFNRSDAITINNVISGAGKLEQNGSGTTTLANNNTYTGDTTINAGKLVLTGSLAGNVINKATFDNAGTVSGNITNNANAIFNQTGGSVAGNLANSGTVNASGGSFTGAIANSGIFNLTGNVDWSSGSFTNSGTVNMLGDAKGSFTNNGTLAVAAGDNVTLNGAYTQNASGILQIGLTDTATYGKLQVTGTADVSQGVILIKVTDDTLLKNGDSYLGLLSATGGITVGSNFLTQTNVCANTKTNVCDTSALWDFVATLDNNTRLDLTAQQATTISETIQTTQIGTPALGAAETLDQLQTDNNGSADMKDVLKAFGQLTTQSQVAAAAAQLTPGVNGGMAQATAGAIQSIGNVIQARQESAQGLSAGDETKAGYLWIKPFSSWADQGKRNGADGFDGNTWGAVLGADSLIDSRSRLGFAVAYARTDIDGKSNIAGHHAEVDTYQAIAYGSHSLDDRTDVNVQVDGGINDNSGRRQIRFAGVNRIAKADYTGWNAHLGLGIRRMMNLDAKTTITPFVRADYTWVDNHGYTEKGANALNLKVNSKSLDELVLSAGGKLNYAVSAATNLSANLGVGYDLIGKDTSITSTFVGGGSAFQTEGIGQQRLRTRGGLGLTTTYGNGLETSVNYDIEARSQFTNQSLSVKVRMAF